MKNQPTTMTLPTELKKKLTQIATKRGVTRNSFILNILWDFIEKEEKQKCMNQ